MHCQVCGRKAHCLNKGKGPLTCCGQPMSKVTVAEAEGWSGTPKGWTHASIVKFGKSLVKGGATKEDFFKKCVEKMKGKIDNPEGFCASVKDEAHGSTFWRGKGKTPQQAGKDVKAHQNVKKG
jgi:desulfoferrodoxin-like iron-binding protein